MRGKKVCRQITGDRFLNTDRPRFESPLKKRRKSTKKKKRGAEKKAAEAEKNWADPLFAMKAAAAGLKPRLYNHLRS